MARRFRRLRRAAHRVVEVTRRLWRFCLCCGAVREETSREMVPVSKVLSCTSLPKVRRTFLCCHGSTDDDRVCHRVISQTEAPPSFIGPMNRIRPTISGITSNLYIQLNGPMAVQLHPVSPFITNFTMSMNPSNISLIPDEVEPNASFSEQRETTGFIPLTILYPATIPIWSVVSSNQTDDHVGFRYLNDLYFNRQVYRQESAPRILGSQNALELYRSSSRRSYVDIEAHFSDTLSSPPQTPSLVSSEESSFTSLRSGPNTRVTQAMGRIELSPIRKSRYQRFQQDDKYLRYIPTPSGSSLVEAPSRVTRDMRCFPWSNRMLQSIHSIPSGTPLDALGSPTGHLSIDISGANTSEEFVSNLNSHTGSSSIIGLHGIINSNRNFIPLTNSTIAGPVPDTSLAIGRPPSSVVLPGCSRVDAKLRLDLPAQKESSQEMTEHRNFRVEICFSTMWRNVTVDSWSQRHTLARTTTGTIDVAYSGQFSQQFVLKSLSQGKYSAEVSILQNCQSSFVVEMHAVLSKGNENLLCLSYYERLDLAIWLHKDERRDYFKESHASILCGYILAGLEFIHSKGFLHLNIKPSNILLCSKGYPVLAGFGSARRISENTGEFRGFSPAYSSPEILSGQAPTRQADLWSTACVFYEIVTNRTPFQGRYADETQLRILSGAIPDVSMLSPDGQCFICAALRSDKSKRIGFAAGAREMMRHRVFHDIGWEEIKYGHRHNDCRLLKVLHDVDRACAEDSPRPSTSVCKNNSRWELWSSSSDDDDESDEEFGFSSRLFPVIEETNDVNIRPDDPTSQGHSSYSDNGIVGTEDRIRNIDPG